MTKSSSTENEESTTVPFEIKGIRLTTYVYPSEDLKTLEEALGRILPGKLREKNEGGNSKDISLVQEPLQLIEKTPLIRLKLNLKKKHDARIFISHLIQNLSVIDQKLVLSKIPLSLSPERILYLRLDKQEAVLGKIKLLHRANLDNEILLPKEEPGHAIQLMIIFKPKLERGKKPSKKRSHLKASDVLELLLSEGFEK